MNEQQEQEETINIKTSTQKIVKRNCTLLQKIIISIVLFILLILILNISIFNEFKFVKKYNNYKTTNNNNQIEDKKENIPKQKDMHHKKKKLESNYNSHIFKNKKSNDIISEDKINHYQSLLENQLKDKNFIAVNKKRTFEKRFPLPKEIKCNEHLKEGGGLLDSMVFLSFLTKNTTFFEFASGCSTFIAKYYAKKSYAVEGNLKWYNIGIKNGLKDNLLFKDLKCDGTGKLLSSPGKKSKLKDWKKFFQAYKKKYDADVIFIDGRFRVSCAFDVFNKIKNDTVVLLHECQRKEYSVIKNYYNLLYSGGSLCVYIKKENISEIPLDIQKKYWHQII